MVAEKRFFGRIYTSMIAESRFLDVYIRPWHSKGLTLTAFITKKLTAIKIPPLGTFGYSKPDIVC